MQLFFWLGNKPPEKYVSWYQMKAASQSSGGRLNKKDGLTRYGDSHVKDKTS